MLLLKNCPDSLLLNVHENTSDTEFWYFYRTELLWHYYSRAPGDNDFWLSFMQFMPIFIPSEVDGKTRSPADCCRNKGWLPRDMTAEFLYRSLCVYLCMCA